MNYMIAKKHFINLYKARNLKENFPDVKFVKEFELVKEEVSTKVQVTVLKKGKNFKTLVIF